MNDVQQPNGSKAPFAAPKLEIYGPAREITRAIGLKGDKDAAVAGVNIKTRLL